MITRKERYYIINNLFYWPLQKQFQGKTNKHKEHYQHYDNDGEFLHKLTSLAWPFSIFRRIILSIRYAIVIVVILPEVVNAVLIRIFVHFLLL